MNKELKSPFLDKKPSCFQITNIKQKQPKKIFPFAALICMSTTAMAAFAGTETSYHWRAPSLIASSEISQSQNHPVTLSQDINSLRQQLLDKTRELQEYKSSLFRASHPQDQAKITELTQRIAEQEKSKQELLAKIKEYESDLINVKKQMKTLEVSAEALTVFIQTQRTQAEAEKNELEAKIRAYEEDPQLENARKINEKLFADLEVLKSSIASYETRIQDLEHTHHQELQDALEDAAMLKFELADTRALAEKKEHEVMISTLNYLTMALDHAKMLKTTQISHKIQLDESQQDLSNLQAVIDEIAHENLRLQKENDQLVQQSHEGQTILSKHFAEKHVLANKLLEKEEALNAALLYYQELLAEQTRLINTLQERLIQEETAKIALQYENEHTISQHSLEKYLFESAISDHSETMREVLLTYQLAINDYLSELTLLQERLADEKSLKEQLSSLQEQLAKEEKNRSELQEEHQDLISSYSMAKEALAQQYEVKEQLERDFIEKEEEYKTALSALQSSTHNLQQELSTLQDSLKQAQSQHAIDETQHDEQTNEIASLKQTLQALSSKQFEDDQHSKSLEEQLSSLSSQIDRDGDMIDRLKQEIAGLSFDISEKTRKENELEHAIHSLTIIAEHQDHALAEANTAFAMVQEYNQHLQAENSDLKYRLDRLEIAERTGKRSSKPSENDHQAIISPALIQLLRPK